MSQLVYARASAEGTDVELCVKGEGFDTLLVTFRLSPEKALDLASELLKLGLSAQRAERDHLKRIHKPSQG